MSHDDMRYVTSFDIATAKPDKETRLTIEEARRILLGERQTIGDNLKGGITTEDKCPVCGDKFEFVAKLGFLCRAHMTTPDHFIITIYVPAKDGTKGGNARVYCDKQGKVLDTWRRTEDVLDEVQQEVKAGTFNIDNYRRSAKRDYSASTLIPMFLAEKKSDLAPSYIDNYVHYCGLHLEFWSKWDVRRITQHSVNVSYLQWIRDHYKKIDEIAEKRSIEQKKKFILHDHSKTIENVFLNFRHFLNWCIEKGSIPASQKVKFSKLHIPKPQLAPPLTADQAFDMCNVYTPIRHRPIIQFLLLHGVRPGEARAIKMSKIDLENQRILIDSTYSDEEYREQRKGKEAPEYYVHIHPESLGWIATQYDNRRSDDEHLFKRPSDGNHYAQKTLEYVWHSIRAKMGLPDYMRLYDATRHTCGTLLARAGYDANDISKILGHTKPSTTKRYTGGVVPPPSEINATLTLLKGSKK